VSVTIITRRGSCGFCPSFVTTIYTRAHRRWWRVSTVYQLVRLDAQNCHYRDYTRFHIWLENHERQSHYLKSPAWCHSSCSA